ncbi:MAG: 6-bladed beta-propeller [Candidatus Zixiibacteriota bacterium]
MEVIINHLEPYKVKGTPSILRLEEEFTIDTERDDLAELGFTDIGSYDVDSDGNIYFVRARETDLDVIIQFDREGNFSKTFGKRGQGPGEIQFPVFLYINENDELPLYDGNMQKLYIFDKEGDLIKEIRIEPKKDFGNFVFYPLENGSFLKHGEYFDPESQHRQNILQLCNSQFETVKELDRCDHGKVVAFTQIKKVFTPRVFIVQISDGKIYVGHEKRGYEILVYDFEGNLMKKIRKEYNPTEVPEDYKENWLRNIGRYENRLFFPEKMPPFHYFFLDDEGRLYVKTYERGTNRDEYMHDIFNSDGLFITRKSMPGYGNWIYPGDSLNRGKARNGHFYCIREKESGYKELVVYKMTWE